MNRNDIVRQYKWMKILRVLIRMPVALLFCLAGCAISSLLILLWASLGDLGCVILTVFITICIGLGMIGFESVSIIALIFIDFIGLFFVLPESLKDDLQLEFNNFINSFYRHFEKKWGMTENEIKDYISRRESLGDNLNLYVLPYVSRLCSLNGEGRQAQETFLSGFLSEDEINFVYRQIYSDSLMPELNKYWRKRPLSEKKPLLDLLFKLAIVQDGIRNDEWNLLMSIMMQWGFNKNYIEFYKDRYSPLRTEFDESEYRSNVSRQDRIVSYLKPYFEILGLDEAATDEEIKRAYHNLALLHHPDLPKNSARIEECETLMTKINEAYEKVRR